MKKLFLIRHAKSSWGDPSVSDFYRKLNKRGKKDAPFMALKIAEAGASPDMILSSPAKRAKKTAQAMAQGVGFKKEFINYSDDIYSSSVHELFHVLKKVNNKINELFLVGHNYAITDLAQILTGEIIENIPTSGVVAMQCRINDWSDIEQGSGELLFFDYPKRYIKK